jgi:hypothetical protein
MDFLREHYAKHAVATPPLEQLRAQAEAFGNARPRGRQAYNDKHT